MGNIYSMNCCRLLLLILITSQAFGQHKNIISNLKSAEKRADELYSKGAYSEAVDLYSQVLEKKPGRDEVNLKIAECYTHLHQPEEAIKWFEKGIDHQDVQAFHKLSYAMALVNLKQYSKAKPWFESYLSAAPNDKRARNQLEALSKIETFYKDSTQYKIRHLKSNSAMPDFGPAFFERGVVFVSGRSQKTPIKYVHTRDQNGFLDLYYSQADSTGELQNPTKLDLEINSIYHDGSISTYGDGSKIIFTRNALKHDGKVSTLKIYEGEVDKNEKVANVIPFPYNNDHYSVAHPTISQDGSTLYFASDMPGGFGQSDIYVSTRVNGGWSTPKNLGPNVNTEGSEIFPFLRGDQLYFTSDGLVGLGGLDVYRLSLSDANAVPENIGYPVNSSKDDFSFIINGRNTGYFASNRRANNDDLFWVRYQSKDSNLNDSLEALAVKPATVTLKGQIIDLKGEPIANASVFVLNEITGEEIALTADEQGRFEFKARPEDTYAILAEKDDVSAILTNINPGDQPANKTIEVIAIRPSFNKPIIIQAYTYDSLSKESVKLVRATLVEGEQQRSVGYTALDGKVFLNGLLAREYSLKLRSSKYKAKTINFSTRAILSDDTLRLNVGLLKESDNVVIMKGNIFTENTNDQVPNAEIYVLNNTTGEVQIVYSDDKGNFQFKGVVGDNYSLLAEKGDLSAMLMNLEILDPADHVNEEVKLIASVPTFPGDITVEVLVTDKVSGQPLKLADVYYKSNSKNQLNHTYSSGKAYFTGISGQAFSVSASLRGYGSQTVDVPLNKTTSIDTFKISFSLDKFVSDLATIPGYIYDEKTKNPLAGASIYMLNEVTGEEKTIKADNKGNFKVDVNLSDSYSIVGEKDNKSIFLFNQKFTEENRPLSKLDLAAKEPTWEKVTDGKMAVVVTVIDSATKKVIKVTHLAVIQHGKTINELVTDQYGKARFVLDLNKTFTLNASHINYHEKSIALETNADRDSLQVKVTLQRKVRTTGIIYGNIFDLEEDSPLSNATIHILNERTGEQKTVAADDKGNFQLTANVNDTYTILGEKDGKSAMLTNVRLNLASKGINNHIQLSVDSSPKKILTILATIIDSESKSPIRLATLTLTQGVNETQTGFSSTEGKAMFRVAQEKIYDLAVELNKYQTKTVQIKPEDFNGRDTLNVTVEVTPLAPRFIQQPLVVYNEKTGKPLANAEVYVLNESTGEDEKLTTDVNGVVSFKSNPNDSYAIMVEKDDFMAFMINMQSKNPALGIDTLEIMATQTGGKGMYVKVTATDKLTKEPVKMVILRLYENAVVNQQGSTATDGTVVFRTTAGGTLKMTTEHVGYKPQALTVPHAKENQDTIFINLQLEKIKPIYTTLYAQVIDGTSNLPMPYAIVTIVNELTGDEEIFMADENGNVQTKVKYSDTYTIISGDEKKSGILSGLQPNDDNSEENPFKLYNSEEGAKKSLALTADELKIIEVLSGREQLFISSNGTIYEYKAAQNTRLLVNKKMKKMLAAQVHTKQGKTLYEEFANYVDPSTITSKVVIKNIYYEFNKANLTEAARDELKKIATVMKEHSEVSIRLNAFADSRGTDIYNNVLSQKRAKAAFDYLIAEGIPRNRILTMGYGEKQQVKPCPKPADCTEDEHQLNRRAEFMIVF